MIELKNLTREQRTLITIQCDSFYIDYKENRAFISVFKELEVLFPARYDKEIWTFITACAKALRNRASGSLFSLSSQDYTTANRINKKKISHKKSVRLINILDKEGFVTLYKGFYDHNSSTSLKSCFIMSDKMISLFDGIDVDRSAMGTSESTFIEIRDIETWEPITDLVKLRGIKAKRNFVATYNNHLKAFDIRIKSKKALTLYKRVFSDSFNGAGRWYSFNGFQTAPKLLRPDITINGEKTTEVDIKSIHPMLLYCLEGVAKPMSFEPYAVPDGVIRFTGEPRHDSARRLCKMALMCLLYAKSKAKAIQALRDKVLDDQGNNGGLYSGIDLTGRGAYTSIFNALIENNKEISHHFFTELLWARLQWYDAEMTAKILSKFIDAGKCALPWHDSYVCSYHDRGFLIEAIRDSWREVMGTTMNCYYKVEF